ncbi:MULTISPECIES: amidase [Pseudomonas]|uniref:Amidase n=1 Tax=Pseudomonas beijingensis TaxID=2954101 RepID=A0ABY9FI45_9PSED|nr:MULTISPECIES: amidase [unclassified Pseudomonas]WLH02568.1 amidase [Pseudomonas sp. FP2034]WLH47645.1 amidase [Pseudomonas sp. FP2262]WLI47423.1 amidase [Pseudomonas sp. FP830]
MKRKILLTLLSVLLIALFGWVWLERVALRAFPDIISAYTAKEYCSCRYVMEQPAEYCRGYVKQSVPISDLLETVEAKRVTVSGLGRSNSAQWLGERQGCRLEP